MKRTLILLALWTSSAGGALWAQEPGIPAPPAVLAAAGPDDAPALWAMLLAGAAVACFTAARRLR